MTSTTDTTDPTDIIWEIPHWDTTGITLLPDGWYVRWLEPDGSTAWEHSPALLLQEKRWTEYGRRGELGGEVVTHRAPYETRVVFASYNQDLEAYADGQLEPVQNCERGYLCGAEYFAEGRPT